MVDSESGRTPPRIIVDDPTPAGIAGAIGRMIRSGELIAGDRLPTVRELSAELGVSPATVSHGWRALSRSGLVESRGRSGTFVTQSSSPVVPRRTKALARTHGQIGLDLSKGSPDPDLLPEIGAALAAVVSRAATTSYHDHPVVPELGNLLRADWPVTAESLTVVDGALDGVARAVATIAQFGDRAIVENPTFPQFLDLIESHGLHPIPVSLDADGPVPKEFADALAQSPTVALLQPRAHNPTGISITPARARELARLMRGTGCIAIEDDHSGGAGGPGDVSIGRWLPEQVVHIRSFSKSHGPDLRIAAMSGPRSVLDRLTATRMLGPGWTPRLLQRLLYELLSDESTAASVAAARVEYQRRRDRLQSALHAHGIPVPGTAGMNLWIPVADERHAQIHLAANGIQVASGEPFIIAEADRDARSGDHIRVTIAALADGFESVAATLAAAAVTGEPDFYPVW